MSRWSQVSDLVAAALEQDEASRPAFLDERCAGDAELRAEVEALLQAHRESGDFLDQPAAVALGFAEAVPEPSPACSLAGRALGPYRIEREIGRGGMGVVYLAEDTRLGRKVAIKVLEPEHTSNDERRARMRIEARAAGSLAHPGIATVFALEELDDALCLVCEYVRGHTLRSEIDRGALDVPVLLDTALQLARALAAAHGAGVIHRDLKPENVIRAENGAIKILDFGVARLLEPSSDALARLTGTGMVLGTPGYMSPEQLEGNSIDARSDIFSLGVVLFELASGTHPFETRTPASTMARVIAGEAPDLLSLNPAVPPALAAVIARCLEKDAEQRYPSAEAVVRDLEALGGDAIVVEEEKRPRARAAKLTPRGWWVFHQAVAMVVAGLAVLPVWGVTAWVQTDLMLALLLGVIAAAAVNGTMRAHLLFTHRFNPGALRVEIRRTQSWLRAADWVFALLLVAAAFPIVRTHTPVSALLAALGLAWIVTSLLIEPATRGAAFPTHSSWR